MSFNGDVFQGSLDGFVEALLYVSGQRLSGHASPQEQVDLLLEGGTAGK